MEDIFKHCTGFDWNDGNSLKNWEKHQVSKRESEQTFFNEPIIVFEDFKLSESETRFFLLGKTDKNRLLLIVFSIRGELIRVISARDVSKKERSIYENKK